MRSLQLDGESMVNCAAVICFASDDEGGHCFSLSSGLSILMRGTKGAYGQNSLQLLEVFLTMGSLHLLSENHDPRVTALPSRFRLEIC